MLGYVLIRVNLINAGLRVDKSQLIIDVGLRVDKSQPNQCWVTC